MILASGTTYMVDLGASNTSDKIGVTATTFTGTTPTNGMANVGGRLALAYTPALRANDLFTILTAQGGVTGAFQTPDRALCDPDAKVIYSANAVQLLIQAGLYSNVVAPGSEIQVAYAKLLDSNRGGSGGFSALYGPLDLQNAATIQSTLTGLAPTTETTIGSIATASIDTTSSFFRDRLSQLDPSELGGTLAHYGQPTQVAALNLNGMGGVSAMGFGGASVLNDSAQPLVETGKLPETMAAFVAGGNIDGDAAAMRGSPAAGRDSTTAGMSRRGIESQVGDDAALGFALSYSRVDGDGAFGGQTARSTSYQGTLYGKLKTAHGITLDTQVSAGLLDATPSVWWASSAPPYTLTSSSQALVFNTETGLGKDFDLGSLRITPRAAFRTTHIGFHLAPETGGPMALTYNRVSFDSAEGAAG